MALRMTGITPVGTIKAGRKEALIKAIQGVEQAKLMASDEGGVFGWASSISSDGNTVIVGAHYNESKGAAYIFTRSGSIWSEQAKLIASDAEYYDGFGASVSISSDGSTAIVGAAWEDTNGNDSGAAYIFV